MKFTILVDLSLMIITVYSVCLINWSRDEDFYLKIMLSHYITFMAMPQHKVPVPGVMKFTMLVAISLVIIAVYSVWLIYA